MNMFKKIISIPLIVILFGIPYVSAEQSETIPSTQEPIAQEPAYQELASQKQTIQAPTTSVFNRSPRSESARPNTPYFEPYFLDKVRRISTGAFVGAITGSTMYLGIGAIAGVATGAALGFYRHFFANQTPFKAGFHITYAGARKPYRFTLNPGEFLYDDTSEIITGVHCAVTTTNIPPCDAPLGWQDPAPATQNVPARRYGGKRAGNGVWVLKGPSYGNKREDQLFNYNTFKENPEASIAKLWNCEKAREIAPITGGATTPPLYTYKAGQITNPTKSNIPAEAKKGITNTFFVWEEAYPKIKRGPKLPTTKSEKKIEPTSEPVKIPQATAPEQPITQSTPEPALTSIPEAPPAPPMPLPK